ncbi:cysteine and histidine-rich protein 1 homolog [Drosophila obscura]|uniref:cysteine and histidine-rich protein 1 homolog n=1 Tax=Drosophila obscura TaxID=7282 RepID=UPI000B9FEA9B|nr:cysteine and histidine-rich protein 1 homolog [Drosophila obscura]XP_022225932.1 cysteine and histidine-rich protein 1 homolog [Drosophila obscura]XP_022230479.1 cysteine and histidine-rich protein 1 homolog [Drosophila obscura]
MLSVLQLCAYDVLNRFWDLDNMVTPRGILLRDSSTSLQELATDLVRCGACNTLPHGQVFQCANGHLLCFCCYQVRMLDKMQALCATCGVRIDGEHNRNSAVERALAEMRVLCGQCGGRMPRSALRAHTRECPSRVVLCKFRVLGCNWIGVQPQASLQQVTTIDDLNLALAKLMCSEYEETLLVKTEMEELLESPNTTTRHIHVLPQEKAAAETLQHDYLPVVQFRAHDQDWSLLLKWQPLAAGGENENPFALLHFRLRLELSAERPAGALPLLFSYCLEASDYSEVSFFPNRSEPWQFSSENALGPSSLIYCHTMLQCEKLLERGLYVRLNLCRC